MFVLVVTTVLSIAVASASYALVEEPARVAVTRWEKRRHIGEPAKGNAATPGHDHRHQREKLNRERVAHIAVGARHGPVESRSVASIEATPAVPTRLRADDGPRRTDPSAAAATSTRLHRVPTGPPTTVAPASTPTEAGATLRHGRGVVSEVAGRRRVGTRASEQQRDQQREADEMPARYQRSVGNSRSRFPSVPAGTIQPCCQPFTTTGRQLGAVRCGGDPADVGALGHHQQLVGVGERRR